MPTRYRELAGNGWVNVAGYELFELARQVHSANNCIFAVGLIDNHPHDSHYLWIEKDGEKFTVLFFRPDELATVAWLCSGALWSHLIEAIKK